MDIAYLKSDNASEIGSNFILENAAVTIPYLVIISIATVIGTFGNILVICAVVYQKELRTTMNMFIVNLAMADLCVTAIVNPFSIVGVVRGEVWFEKKPALCEFIACICLTSCYCSLLNSGMIAVDRYIHLIHANLYKRFYTTRNTIIMCVCVWLVSFLVEMPNFFGWGDHSYDKKTLSCVWDRSADLSYSIFFSIFGVAIPSLLIGICYGIIYKYIRASKARINHPHVIGLIMPDSVKNIEEHMHDIVRMTFLTFLTFVICWAPYAIVVSIDHNDVFPRGIHLYAILLAHVNSSLNNILYGIANNTFRHAYMKLLGCRHCMSDLENTKNGSSIFTPVNDSWSVMFTHHAKVNQKENTVEQDLN